MIIVSIPAAEPEVTARSPEKAHTVFLVEVLCNGRRHTVAKRYSEFQALHKRIKKSCKVPDFPPRRVPNWVPKVLEQRRQGLELYIQGVLCHNEELPQDVLDFLKVRRCQLEPKGCSPVVSHSPPQRPVLGFHTDPYAWPPAMDVLPNTVLSGVLHGFYTPWHCPPCTAVPRGQLGS
ncbi:sorting nexin-22 isoform X1 [Tympanuchus pallidicinctus]|uniref:sorting nexin-22 isoform X1 n=1 Tax=Tympanuchus pallidicinctus TaxID=109042 RepID=UPI002286E0D7|nr:sorting nexin-22 isoform X1 [Tympanuchus pallidicinctus]